MAERQTISSGGPFEPVMGYSRALRVGDQVFVAGTCARGAALEADAGGQAEDALATIGAALKDAGSRFEDVVRTVVYLIDRADFDAVAQAHGAVFGAIRPANTTVIVTGLADPRMRVEIEVTAVIA